MNDPNDHLRRIPIFFDPPVQVGPFGADGAFFGVAIHVQYGDQVLSFILPQSHARLIGNGLLQAADMVGQPMPSELQRPQGETVQ